MLLLLLLLRLLLLWRLLLLLLLLLLMLLLLLLLFLLVGPRFPMALRGRCLEEREVGALQSCDVKDIVAAARGVLRCLSRREGNMAEAKGVKNCNLEDPASS